MNKLEKVLPNQLKQATKSMAKYLKDCDTKLPQEISEAEKGHFHVAFIVGGFNPRTDETKWKINIKKFNDRAWEVNSKKFAQIGEPRHFIIHNPTLKAVKSELGNTGTDGNTDTKSAEQKTKEAKEYREALKVEAKDLGFEGKMNSKNPVFEAFIKEVKDAEAELAKAGNTGADGGDENAK